jgi:hypothetical protein
VADNDTANLAPPIRAALVDSTGKIIASLPVTIADNGDFTIGSVSDAAVTGDNTGTVSAKLRGLDKILSDIWDPINHVLKTTGGVGVGAVTVVDGSDVAEGATTDAAVITDTTGTISGKLRGLVKWAFERMPASLGQKVMASSLPVVLASDQASVPVAATLGAETTKVIGTVNVAAGQTIAVTQGTAANLKSLVDINAAQTLATVTNLSQMSGAAIAMGTGARSAGTQRVTVATDDVVPVTDNASSLTVDAPVGTPVFVRLSDGAAAQVGQKAMTASLPVVLASDQASVPVASTLTAETTKVIGTVRNIGNAGANFDAATAAAVPANGLYIGGSDGTNLRGVLTTSAANLTAATTLGAVLSPPFATWSITHRPVAATKATASKAAGAAGVRHVCTGFSFNLATVGTAQAAVLNCDIIDGATGGATRLASFSMGGIPVNSQHTIIITGIMLIGTAATAMTIEFDAAGAAASFERVNLQGFSVS